MTSIILLLLGLGLISAAERRAVQFSFSPNYADNMVLQRGARGASVWGHSPKVGDQVTLYVNGKQSGTVPVDTQGIWHGVVHDPGSNNGNTIAAVSSLGNITLHDVLFGDVWVCSGQSNMAFAVSGLANATEEFHDATNYPNIRLFKTTRHISNTELTDFPLNGIFRADDWAKPSKVSVQGFSAVCWLFGKYLSTQVSHPIGLVESDWGGTPVEAWSSTDALHMCNNTQRHNVGKNYQADTVLWNALIHPLIKTTIFGALWYQGESNAGNAFDYSCRFPAMINDWRAKFHANSKQTTEAMFPFGFVQLAPFRNTTSTGSFPMVRWAQTANHGRVPNIRMRNVFMAVALDLPDYKSPRGAIHPRLKHDIAARLVLGALGVAYNMTGVDYQGPYPSSFSLDKAAHTITVQYDQGRSPIDVRMTNGFQICCTVNGRVCGAYTYALERSWMKVPIKSHDTASVTVDVSKCDLKHHTIGGIRYEWSESPCDFKQCAIYGADNYLPAPPFIVVKNLV